MANTDDLLLLSSPTRTDSKRTDDSRNSQTSPACSSELEKSSRTDVQQKTVEEEERDEFGLLIPKRKTVSHENSEKHSKQSPKISDEIDPEAPKDNSSESSTRGNSDNSKGHEPRYSISSTKSNGVKAEDGKRASVIGTGKEGQTAPPPPKPEVSEYSHLAVVTKQEEVLKKKDENVLDDDGEWQEMPAYASHDMYDDDGRLVAKEAHESDEEGDELLGGARKGYTRVNDDEDTQSVTSMDENTSYLFNNDMDDEASKTPLSQMQATKELLTEGQRIAYVGVCRLVMAKMVKEQEKVNGGKGKNLKKALGVAVEHTRMWSQKMIHRLYAHMDINTAEQIMIEQLDEHGVLPSDLVPTLMKNARVNNPLNQQSSRSSRDSFISNDKRSSSEPPPSYKTATSDDLGDIRTPNMLSDAKTLDIDLRWTVLFDLFLVLIADSVYDSRSRVLLEKVGQFMDISWIDISKFEKKVTDALEVQEAVEQNWSEAEHMENRRKASRNRRYMLMGLATIGGGLVIGLSGGLLAPVIGAGLAAGFTTIGVAGTGTFLAGAGGTAIIASTAVVSGATIGGKASLHRTENVKTFEYRPLHNSKRVNLIITISGWMSGKEDDVRLPFSTVDPIMGDLFSVLWEPEMLKSMGQTINILATEVLTQSLQQILGSTILTALMASIQLPVVLTKLSYLLDNPWSVSLDRATSAGLILADSLISRNLGVRPVTLVGYSLGARVIFSCLKELHRRHAYGLVQNVYMFGSPVVVKKEEYAKARTAVAGRFVNGYSQRDWVLGYLFRATSGGIGRVAGLAPISDIEGIENIDVTEFVDGHFAYRQAMPKLLRRVDWLVLEDEFSEIEDPDPDQHRERQRELINELHEARKELEKEPTKKGLFGLFGKTNKDIAKKKDWETYKADNEGNGSTNNDGTKTPSFPREGSNDVLFDVDAIRAEIEKQTAQEAKSHEEPDKAIGTLNIPSNAASLRHVKSFDHTTAGLKISTTDPSLTKPSSHKHTPSSPVKQSYDVKENYYYSEDDEDEFGNKRNAGDGEIQMTFGRWDEPPPRPSPSIPTTQPSFYELNSYGHSIGGIGYSQSTMTPATTVIQTKRTNTSSMGGPIPPRSSSYGLYSSPISSTPTGSAVHQTPGSDVSAPITTVSGGMALPEIEPSNVWADDNYYDEYDDEDFGQEKEVTMSFA
ncbi:hypothetical protein BDZ91DRAFT_720401 [Kalaharituber pfeilii]|nr:hypothetical protein BDZ91DRAFT_720401 [Kalaharituber pfeilii]